MVKPSGIRAARYVPDRGDIVWLDFNPQAGHEQTGRRPALVLSPRNYNEKTSLALFCPITSRIKGYSFEAIMPPDNKISGAVLCDQIKSFDWSVRKVKFIVKAPPQTLAEAVGKARSLMD